MAEREAMATSAAKRWSCVSGRRRRGSRGIQTQRGARCIAKYHVSLLLYVILLYISNEWYVFSGLSWKSYKLAAVRELHVSVRRHGNGRNTGKSIYYFLLTFRGNDLEETYLLSRRFMILLKKELLIFVKCLYKLYYITRSTILYLKEFSIYLRVINLSNYFLK